MKKQKEPIRVTDIAAPELDIYARAREPELAHYYEPDGGIFIAESPNVIGRALDAGYVPISLLAEEKYLADSPDSPVERCGDIPVYTAALSVLNRITGYPLTRGLLCAMRRRPLPEVREVLNGARRIAVLENIQNPTNVGAIFRAAAALGMDGILLTKGCADPLQRRAVRVSMGSVFQIPWTFFPGGEGAQPADIGLLRKEGFFAAAMALKKDALSLQDDALRVNDRIAVILGNEGEGLSEETIRSCDASVCIPMKHGVDSLNVAAAAAVAFWEVCR
ncbi:MAG: RNA methyltransferase [Lachnospiraceae bacterium]|nr:RNA methyltransferase [Lachnospiraceae bacterium]